MDALAGMLLADARLPAGSSSHSAGLEAAWMAGLTASEVPGYMESRLRTVAALDASAAVLAHRAAVALRERPDAADTGFRAIDRAISARTPSAPMRVASRQLGRGLLRLADALAPADPAIRAVAADSATPYRAIVLGALGSALGLDESGVASVVCYDEAQSVASAALKVMPGDPTQATAWVLGLMPVMRDVVHSAIGIDDQRSLPAWSAPWSEHWIHQHAHNTRRLFVS